jgi:ankyrin repeat protein
VDGEDQIPVDADHRNICKFATRDNVTYVKLFKRLCRMLKDQGINSGYHGSTPLHQAAQEGDMDKLRYLLKGHKADIDAEDDDGMTPLHYAATAGHEEIVRTLLGRLAEEQTQ